MVPLYLFERYGEKGKKPGFYSQAVIASFFSLIMCPLTLFFLFFIFLFFYFYFSYFLIMSLNFKCQCFFNVKKKKELISLC